MPRVMLWVGAGQIGLAIARRMGVGMKIHVGDVRRVHAEVMARMMREAGYDTEFAEVDVGDRASVREFVARGQALGDIAMFVGAAGLAPETASPEEILRVGLYGAAVLLEEVGRVIAPGGVGVALAGQSGHMLPALSPQDEAWLASAPAGELLKLSLLQPENIRDAFHAGQLAHHGLARRVMAEAVKWGARGARINAISPGQIVTPSVCDAFKGPRGALYKKMCMASPAGRPGVADEIAHVAEFLMGPKGAFITGADILVDGGLTASSLCGALRPEAASRVKLYLTSSAVGTYRVDGVDYAGLNPQNGLVDELRRDWRGHARCLLVAADPDAHDMNRAMAGDMLRRFRESGLHADHFDVCDRSGWRRTMDKIPQYDVIVLGGGHVPTQNAFMHEIGFMERIREFDGIVMGISAGSMNCARTVYAQPELQGESLDPGYSRFIEGLGLTECQVLPHYQSVKDDVLDGQRLFEDITFGDSYGHAFIAIPDGSFILQRDGLPVLHGEGYLVSEGRIEPICADGETLPLD